MGYPIRGIAEEIQCFSAACVALKAWNFIEIGATLEHDTASIQAFQFTAIAATDYRVWHAAMLEAVAFTAPIACAADISKVWRCHIAFEHRHKACWGFIRVQSCVV